MAYRQTCTDCSAFDPNQGMEAHPIFNTPEEWADHRYKSHGGPKPKPSAVESVGRSPYGASKPQHDSQVPAPPPIEELLGGLEYDDMVKAVGAQMETMEQRLAFTEKKIDALSNLAERVLALESKTFALESQKGKE